ncbi:hypothetical protein PCASD_08051 [Puccinia coronata f. sp. avenae]|uniref:Uncharacterized protein n=1 Tax=Puccinia coronata f. sp. avenae TaxID=200324 RepID=A0A2N5UZJ4_9BASI|nr:hypothetical protein PCASD_08051 [Puccinia coronata f. sp. avenae]
MRRKLTRLAGQSGKPKDEEESDDDQEIDLFSRLNTALIEDKDKLDEDDDDEKGDQVDLDSVADVTTSLPQSPKSHEENSKLNLLVRVREIPAKNRSLRVAEILSANDNNESNEEDAEFHFDDDERGSEDEEDNKDGSEYLFTNDSSSTADSQDSQDEDGGGKTMSRLSGGLSNDGFSQGLADPDGTTGEEELSRHAKKMKRRSPSKSLSLNWRTWPRKSE